jgi:hypothetical protein
MMAVGALQLLPYLYGLVLFRGGWLIWEKRAPLPWGVLMLALFLALGLTGGLWLSLWELRGTLSRTELSVEDASLYAFEPVALLGLVLANHGGFHETLSYVGVAVGVLAGLACVRTWRKHTPWVLLLLGVFLYSLGQSFPLWRVLFELLPPLRLLRVPSRAWFIAALLFPYLAGWGLESLLAEPPRSARLRLALFALLARPAFFARHRPFIIRPRLAASRSILVGGGPMPCHHFRRLMAGAKFVGGASAKRMVKR